MALRLGSGDCTEKPLVEITWETRDGSEDLGKRSKGPRRSRVGPGGSVKRSTRSMSRKLLYSWDVSLVDRSFVLNSK